MRDDFNNKTKKILAQRVAYICSNPDCRLTTVGASSDSNKSVNIGVAAHICAASQGGPRYDEHMTSEERSNADNGIWLCQNCAKKIDSDVRLYTVQRLLNWKKKAEENANRDIEYLKFFVQCLDRPAFTYALYHGESSDAVDQALEDTIVALNTGVLIRRSDRLILKSSEGKSFIKNSDWREGLDRIEKLIVDYRIKLNSKEVRYYEQFSFHNCSSNIYDKKMCEEYEELRTEIFNIFSLICKEAGINCYRFSKLSWMDV